MFIKIPVEFRIEIRIKLINFDLKIMVFCYLF